MNRRYIFWGVITGMFLMLTLYGQKLSKQIDDQSKQEPKMTHYNKLTSEEQRVILNKGTECPFTGKYDSFYEDGTYHCKQCGAPLYTSEDKFKSGCGWPAFDDEIKGAIKRVPDANGRRVEIVCAQCGGHLGHVFKGEKLTKKNIRHCVNSISLEFKPKAKTTPVTAPITAKAYFAGGCFWGVEYYFEQLPGVISAISGYMGGALKNPTYKDVSYKNTGHLEVVEINYDPSKVDYETLAKLFFEIHNPEQTNGQGPDIGPQYHSAIFYNDTTEKDIAKKLITLLEQKGYHIATTLKPIKPFWKAEDYHQDYYDKTEKTPYCHVKTNRF